ncbi:YcxB family protein [bacterium 1XD8-76]|nr:YcxB family protein [bacterium 1XD8-76]
MWALFCHGESRKAARKRRNGDSEMEMELDIRITKKDLYDYQLHHAYTSPSGLFGTIVGCLFLVGFFNTGTPLYLIIGAFVILYFPWTLHIKAASQAAAPVFQKPLHYRLSEEGLEITAGEERQLVPWESVIKASSTGKTVLLYTSKVNAFLFPKRELGERSGELVQLISRYVSPDKVKIRAA